MCAYDVELLHEPYALLMLPIRHNGMTPTQTTAENMCNTVSWLIRRRRRVSDQADFKELAIVVVVVAVVVSSVVGSAVIVVVVSVGGLRK